MGDNITPPQQAFNWIADVYGSTEEIKANGQTIVGLLHEDIGHLGIFVSGTVAKKEHAQIVEVLKYIQELPPGLYGMQIHELPQADGTMAYDVTLHERKLEDLKRLQKYDRVDEKPFEAVAALSELTERAYSLLVRPFVRDADARMAGARDARPASAARRALDDLRQESVAVAAAVPRAGGEAPAPAAAATTTMATAAEHFASDCLSRVARPVSRPARCRARGRVLRGLRQHAVAADGRRARRDEAPDEVRPARAAGGAPGARDDRRGRPARRRSRASRC